MYHSNECLTNHEFEHEQPHGLSSVQPQTILLKSPLTRGPTTVTDILEARTFLISARVWHFDSLWSSNRSGSEYPFEVVVLGFWFGRGVMCADDKRHSEMIWNGFVSALSALFSPIPLIDYRRFSHQQCNRPSGPRSGLLFPDRLSSLP